MNETLNHIKRVELPWRSSEDLVVTECGLDSTNVTAMDRNDFFEKLKDYGQQRMALLTCMTCFQTTRQYKTWLEDPRDALQRELLWENPRIPKRGDRLKTELIAIGKLIAAHQEEFQTYIERQAWIEKSKKIKNKRIE